MIQCRDILTLDAAPIALVRFVKSRLAYNQTSGLKRCLPLLIIELVRALLKQQRAVSPSLPSRCSAFQLLTGGYAANTKLAGRLKDFVGFRLHAMCITLFGFAGSRISGCSPVKDTPLQAV